MSRKEDDPLYKPSKEENTSDSAGTESSIQWDESELDEPAMGDGREKYIPKVPEKAPVKKRPRVEDTTYTPKNDDESSSEEDDAKDPGGTKRRKIHAVQLGSSFTPKDEKKRKKGQPSRDTSQEAKETTVPTPKTPPPKKETTVPTKETKETKTPASLFPEHKVAYPQPDIPGFADIFTPGYKPKRKPTPDAPKIQKPAANGADSKKPSSSSGPQASTIWGSLPPLSTSQRYATSSNGDPIGDQERDWPPYQGTIYCEPCFRHDCLRAIRLRRDTLLILNLLGGDEALLDFVHTVKMVVGTKTSLMATPTDKAFFEQISSDLSSLFILRYLVRQSNAKESKDHTQQTKTKQANIQAALERMYQILNLTESSVRSTYKKWKSSWTETVEALGSRFRRISKTDIEPHIPRIRQELYLQLGITLPPTPNQQHSLLWEQKILQSIGDNITLALGRISSSSTWPSTATSNGYTAPTAIFSNMLPHLNCTYCLQSGASNKQLALRPYPRPVLEDAARPWTEALQLSFPFLYDDNPKKVDKNEINLTTAPRTTATTTATKKPKQVHFETTPKIKTSKEFLTSLASRKEVEQVTINGIIFLVLRNKEAGTGTGTTGTGYSPASTRPPTPHPSVGSFAAAKSKFEGAKDGGDKFSTRLVLVEMKSLFWEIAWGPLSGTL
ncbi:hypothetical protein QBC37DRAFT_466330 [Rhypophila decipiens]|uniref:Uncharacterized protein n=1 Tax=Rhypophila decipiens TaxID=261697 RepID=A0AAN6YLC3_9PEZI|nr:hypothetical protein QBC37DRAFT_466330 [Rhypophila decipiens]